MSLSLTPDSVTAVTRLEQFPGEVVAKAVVGDVDVAAEITGILRFTHPFGTGGPRELRLATERIRLERVGIVTEGNLSLSLIDRVLTVDQATFEGAGRWEAGGRVAPDRLDFHLLAEEADITPLLGLFPRLAAFGIGARGSVELQAGGTLDRPSVRATSESLELTAAGGHYLLSGGELTLEGERLQLEGDLLGLDQVMGELAFNGSGHMILDPPTLEDVDIAFMGAASAPLLGTIEALSGRIAGGSDRQLSIEAEGRMGNPVRIEGSLTPLDVRIRGTDLELRAPDILLASSQADLDLAISFDRVVRLSGSLSAKQARFALGIRPPRPEFQEPSPALEQIVFDELRIVAPQRVSLSESFGSLELGLDLTLLGTAARPLLSGSATALRGSLRFSGQNFDLVSAEAFFDPSRGVFPQIEVFARTSFDKSRVLASSEPGLEFVAPRGTNSFDVDLELVGEILPSETEGEPFTLDVDPTLTSGAVIQEPERGQLVSGPRPLTEDELFALVTLGRLELRSNLTGEGGIAPTVVQTALDTAFSLLLLSELQEVLGEALGLDVVEIRTSALSSVLDVDNDDPFGVSFPPRRVPPGRPLRQLSDRQLRRPRPALRPYERTPPDLRLRDPGSRSRRPHQFRERSGPRSDTGGERCAPLRHLGANIARVGLRPQPVSPAAEIRRVVPLLAAPPGRRQASPGSNRASRRLPNQRGSAVAASVRTSARPRSSTPSASSQTS